MPITLTPKEKNIYSYIKEMRDSLSHSPTYEEIRSNFGYRSMNSVQKAIITLEEKGYLSRAQGKKRGISLANAASTTIKIPLVGYVACGTPILAMENIEAYVPTDKDLITDDVERYFYLHAVGDSMDEAGIRDNDLTLIHSQSTANEGDRVVALIEDSATIKHLTRKNGYVVLEPRSSNPAHKPIILTSEFLIQGVVIDVLQA